MLKVAVVSVERRLAADFPQVVLQPAVPMVTSVVVEFDLFLKNAGNHGSASCYL